jgi:hypothetical protein
LVEQSATEDTVPLSSTGFGRIGTRERSVTRAFWAVTEPLVGVAVGLFICWHVAKQAIRSARAQSDMTPRAT